MYYHREDLVIELQAVKKSLLAAENSVAHLKGENQRLEAESIRQQRRIEQLLSLADGSNGFNVSTEIRRDLEKSILVRQLKAQINAYRAVVTEKDSAIEELKRNVKSSHMMEVENEREEYYLETIRLKTMLSELKESYDREKQRREWNSKLAGGTGEDLRKEVARLATGYQQILSNIGAPKDPATSNRPSSSSGFRTVNAAPGNHHHSARPQSASSSHHHTTQSNNNAPRDINRVSLSPSPFTI